MKITDYHVVEETLDELQEEVIRAINEGWQPYGHLITHVLKEEQIEFIYGVQVLVKYEED